MNTHQPPNVLMPPQMQNNLMNWGNHNIYAKNDISSCSFSSPLKEFVDYSAGKREEHRQMAQLSDNQNPMKTHALVGGMVFECIADEELEDMLSHDLTSCLNNEKKIVTKLITSDDHNINNICDEIRKNEFSNCVEITKNNIPNEGKLSEETESKSHESSRPLMNGEFSSLSDCKRQRRILANRQSAQRSRIRKLNYITDLETKVATLQTEVSSLTPRVAYFDQQRSKLAISNGNLKQRIAALSQDKKFKDAHHDSLRKEIERLTLIHEQQTAQKMGMDEAKPVPGPNSPGSVKETEPQLQSS